MNYTLQLHSEHRTYPVPRGLHDLMEDISREVLRNQPKGISLFIAEYLEAMVKTRNAVKGLVDAVDDAIAEGVQSKVLIRKYGLTKEEADHHAALIQAAFRGYKAREEFKRLLAAKRKEDGQIRKKLHVHSINYILEKNEISFIQASSAATKIQAAYRGFIVRKKSVEVPRIWHDSWRHDWLWKEFKMSPEEINKLRFPEAEEEDSKEISLLYAPKRTGLHSVEAERSRVLSIFKGRLGDYDDILDESLSELSLYDDGN